MRIVLAVPSIVLLLLIFGWISLNISPQPFAPFVPVAKTDVAPWAPKRAQQASATHRYGDQATQQVPHHGCDRTAGRAQPHRLALCQL